MNNDRPEWATVLTVYDLIDKTRHVYRCNHPRPHTLADCAIGDGRYSQARYAWFWSAD